MNNWIDLSFILLTGAALLLSVVGLWLTAVMPSFDRWNKRFFRVYFVILMLCSLSSLLDMVLLRLSSPRRAIVLLLVLESLLLSLPLPMQTLYLLHSTGESARSSRLLRSVFCLWTVYFVLVIIAPFFSAFSWVTPDNQYIRGPWYPLLLLPVAVIALLNLAGAVQRRRRFSRKVFTSLLIALLPMAVALLVQMMVDVYPIVDISFVLSALSMYSLILSDQIERDLRHQREIANQRVEIMVLEMRPHFIYNTLTSVYCLCKQDPERARQVIMDFTTYLRRNFKALARSEPIPFTDELEHTRAYLSVEQAQYEDSLFVVYDTPHTFFRVPSLTLQPIVENAVKHGRDPYAGPFHISIRTRKTDSGSEIIVADDGRGFAHVDDSEPHIALKNIQNRLEMMCGGRLIIAPNDGGGTVVTVMIPDRPAE